VHVDNESGAATAASAHDQFLEALTEILTTAAGQDSHDMASTLRELAAAAEALADTLDRDGGRA
jgi:hypothetical protein